MHPERRKLPRMNVEGIGFVTLSLKDSYDLLGTLEGVSRQGLQVDLLPTGPSVEPLPGDDVALGELPRGLRAVFGGRRGRVAWIEGSHCGIVFDAPVPLDDADLEARLRDNHLLPWDMWS